MNWLGKENTALWGLATLLIGAGQADPTGRPLNALSLTHNEGNYGQVGAQVWILVVKTYPKGMK
jgi:hypothetical protein